MKAITLSALLQRACLLLVGIFTLSGSRAQPITYADSLLEYRQSYKNSHGVIKGADTQYLHFFPVNESFRVRARVQQIMEAPWFRMETSGREKQVYRVYAILHFRLGDSLLALHVYQSQRLMGSTEYADHLFIPFTDRTCGEESYENGRYLDLHIRDLESGSFVLDFNKAYNPYCAYISDQFNCPIPPRENDLPVAVRAGEMKFGKGH